MNRSPFDGIRFSRTQVPWHAAVLILPDLLTAAMILCKAVSLIIDTIGPDRVSHNVLRIGVRTLVFDDAHMMLSAALLGKGGLAIAFSQSGARLAAIYAIELARKNGANTIGVIHYSDRPLACDGGVVLCSVAQNPSLLGKTATASTAPLNVSDPVFIVAVINLSRTIKVLQSTRKYRSPL